jgi:hypothetical protein
MEKVQLTKSGYWVSDEQPSVKDKDVKCIERAGSLIIFKRKDVKKTYIGCIATN